MLKNKINKLESKIKYGKSKIHMIFLNHPPTKNEAEVATEAYKQNNKVAASDKIYLLHWK